MKEALQAAKNKKETHLVKTEEMVHSYKYTRKRQKCTQDNIYMSDIV